MLPSECWIAAMPGIFFCPRTWRRTCANTGIGNRTCMIWVNAKSSTACACTCLTSTRMVWVIPKSLRNSDEEEGNPRPPLPSVQLLLPVGPSMCLPLFCSFQLWLWRSAFQSFTDEAHRQEHAPLLGKPPTQDFLLRKRVSPCFRLKTGAKTKPTPTLP